MKSGKLVRDKIPLFAPKGKFRVLKGAEFRRELAKKLVEEAREFCAEPSLEELADVIEVVKAILKERGETMQELETVRKKKKSERGGFQKKLFLTSQISISAL